MQQWTEAVQERIIAKYERAAALAAAQGVIPYQSAGNRWAGPPFDGNSWWTGGFWPGLMWQLYHASGRGVFREEALRVEGLLVEELARFELLNHDVGFMYMLSCGAHYRMTGDQAARRNALHAANLLAGRFNPVGYISAWNQNRPGWAIIDCMMNLSLLYWASEETGDPRFGNIARVHADTTLREFLREDGSCDHIVIFDPETGKALDKPAGQGYAKGSSWSRGQAWALYGFAISYRYTRESRYLEAACQVARYFISQIRPDGLTDSDFRQPQGEERIDNIAAACAACGLLELSDMAGNPREGEAFRAAAVRMLRALEALCADWTDAIPGILTRCTASYHEDGAGRHSNIMYGDYFFVEAILRLGGSEARLWFSTKNPGEEKDEQAIHMAR